MKKILIGTFAVIASVCVILLVIQTKEKSEIKEKLNRAEGIFQSNFSLLCSNLNEQETAETNEENMKHAYVCFSILKLTSFSESEAMNKVVHCLYDLSEKKALYTEINETGKKDLNKLCQNLHDENLLNKIIEEISLTSSVKQVNPTDVPVDFCFSLEWGCNGDSTYDSKTGRLIKQRVATKIEDYTTTLLLSDEQKTEIYSLISDMKPETYPDEYNPLKGMSAPSRNIILTVTYNGKTSTITCMNVSLGNTPDGSKGKKFMAVHDKIVDIITSSTEWQMLPDYEFYYD